MLYSKQYFVVSQKKEFLSYNTSLCFFELNIINSILISTYIKRKFHYLEFDIEKLKLNKININYMILYSTLKIFIFEPFKS